MIYGKICTLHITFRIALSLLFSGFLESDIYPLGQILPTQPHESSCVSRPYVYRLSLPT